MSLNELLRETVSGLETLVHELSKAFPAPEPMRYADYFVFRHDPKCRSDVLASYLKAVRVVSLLNASLCLLENGHAIEVNTLCRMIDEAVEDVIFLALKIGENGTSEDQRRLLSEFYQEEFADPTDPLSTTEGDRVPRKKIRAALSNMQTGFVDATTMQKVTKSLFQVFSGFVHGSYVSIMEMYGGFPPRYHTNGMLNTPRVSEYEENFINHVFRSAMLVELVANRANRKDISNCAVGLSRHLAEVTGCVKDDGLERLKKRESKTNESPSG